MVNAASKSFRLEKEARKVRREGKKFAMGNENVFEDR